MGALRDHIEMEIEVIQCLLKKTAPLLGFSTIRTNTNLALLLDKVKFIYPDPHLHSRREAIHIKYTSYSNNINRDSGIEVLEAWMPMIRQHRIRSLPQRAAEGAVSSSNNVSNICFGSNLTDQERGS